jgi:predicted methyltransferase
MVQARRAFAAVVFGALLAAGAAQAMAQARSVHPGINSPYEHPDFARSVRMFESEGREVYDRRGEIVAALGLKPGMRVADVGAGTGLFVRLLSPAVGPQGRVYAVDIAPEFVHNIVRLAREEKLSNVEAILGGAHDARLPPGSVDLVFTSDTYHHFEYPQDMLASIHRALSPGGTLVVVDYQRIAGVSGAWILDHVRAGKETVIAEIEAAGFKLVEDRPLLRDNYFLRFRRLDG